MSFRHLSWNERLLLLSHTYCLHRTDAKIAKMEAKLRQMQAQSSSSEVSSANTDPGSSKLTHPSLPPKPVYVPPQAMSTLPEHRQITTFTSTAKRESRILPSLPLAPPPHPPAFRSTSPHSSTTRSSVPVSNIQPAKLAASMVMPSKKSSSLLGVRIVKNKKE